MRTIVCTVFWLFLSGFDWADNYRTLELRTLIGDFNGYRTGQVLPQFIETSQKENNNDSDDESLKDEKAAKLPAPEEIDINEEQQAYNRALLEQQKKEKEKGKKESRYEINKFEKYLIFLAKKLLDNHKTCLSRKQCLSRDLETLQVLRRSQRTVKKETYYDRGSSYTYGRRNIYNKGAKKERKTVTVRDQQILDAIEVMIEEIKRLPDQELFNLSPIIFEKMSEEGRRRWGLAADGSDVENTLVRVRRITSIAQASFNDIAIYLLTKVEEVYARCESRDKCASAALKELRSTAEEISKKQAKLDKKNKSHQELSDRLTEVVDNIYEIYDTAEVEERQEIYDTIGKLVLPKFKILTGVQALAEMKKIGYRPHKKTRNEQWYNMYEEKIRDPSRHFKRHYEVIGSKSVSVGQNPAQKLAHAKKKRKSQGLLGNAKAKLASRGMSMAEMLMSSAVGMLMGQLGVKMPAEKLNQANSNTVKQSMKGSDSADFGLGEKSSRSTYANSYSGTQYGNKYRSGYGSYSSRTRRNSYSRYK